MSLPLNQVILGDCGDVKADWPGNSVDCVVTDPPYRIGFMGKSWDRALPPRRAFRQIYRVLKPGALAFIMSSPRQDLLWRMLAMLDEIGFELRQSHISWIYKTGFPKAYDVSKGIDRKLGLERDVIGSKGLHSWDSEKGSLRNHYGEYEGDFEKANQLTAPASDLAKQWEGWKSQTGLKPALECILMVNKPRSEPTIVDNVLNWGTGAVNVNASRIPYKNKEDFDEAFRENRGKFSSFNPIEGLDKSRDTSKYQKGRFPANLLLSSIMDCDEIELIKLQEALWNEEK